MQCLFIVMVLRNNVGERSPGKEAMGNVRLKKGKDELEE